MYINDDKFDKFLRVSQVTVYFNYFLRLSI